MSDEKPLRGSLFPDSCFRDRSAFHASLIYFDRVVVRNIRPPRGVMVTAGPGYDGVAAQRQADDREQVLRWLWPLSQAGIVEDVGLQPGLRAAARSFALRFLQKQGSGAVLEAAADELLDLDALLTMRETREDSELPSMGEVWNYTWRAFLEVLTSAIDPTAVVTHEKRHYDALSALQGEVLTRRDTVQRRGEAELFRLSLPAPVLATPEHALEVRALSAEHLGRLRTAMRGLSSQLSPDLPDHELRRAAADLVATEVVPAVEELERFVAGAGKRALRSAFTPASCAAAIGVSFVGPLPATLTALAGFGIYGLVKSADDTREKLMQHPFTFLLRAGKPA